MSEIFQGINLGGFKVGISIESFESAKAESDDIYHKKRQLYKISHQELKIHYPHIKQLRSLVIGFLRIPLPAKVTKQSSK